MRLRESWPLVVGCVVLLAAGAVVGVRELTQRGGRTVAARTVATQTTRTHERPPSGHRERVVTSARAFTEAVEQARPGETIKVTGDVTISGEFTFDRVVPGRGVDVVLGPGVRFTGGKPSSPAVFVRGAGGWRIHGGTITNPSGDGILLYALPGPFAWTGFRVHDTAGTCVSVLPVGGNIDRVSLQGLAGTARPDLGLDPHSENGTGIHAWNIGDADGGLVENSTFHAGVVDQATGAGVQIDTSHVGPHVEVSAQARHLGFAIPGTIWHGYARRQVAGNVVQLWGGTPPGSLDRRNVEGAGIQGRLVDASGVSDDADLSSVRVGVARATGPILQSPLLAGPPVQLLHGMRHGG